MLDNPWIQFAIILVIALVVAFVAVTIVSISMRAVARRKDWAGILVKYVRKPFRALALLIAAWIAVTIALPDPDDMYSDGINQIFTILVIAASVWMMIALMYFATNLMLGRYRTDVPDNRVARRIRTQVLLLRRVAIAILVIIGVGSIMLTFPGVRTIGASILASAGLASVVAGLAAQSVLSNVFAGVQLVFSEALRVDDVIVAEGEWGKVGEITLTYVVLDLWDDRRLVFPTTYFTTQPFQNWTRKGSELLGAVELDVDWRISPARMREHLDHILEGTDLWDRRASVLQVTDATGGYVRIRILATAQDAAILFDLRCLIREQMVLWLQREMPGALPTQRVIVSDGSVSGSSDYVAADDESGAAAPGLFTGSIEAQERAAVFTQAIPTVDTEDGAQTTETAPLPERRDEAR